MKLAENMLDSAIKAGRLDRLYYLYGKEPALTRMYAERIIKKAVGDDPLDFNLIRFEEVPEPDMLSEQAEELPVFADRKVITVKNFFPENTEDETLERYIDIISDIPDTTVIIFFTTTLPPEKSEKKEESGDSDKSAKPKRKKNLSKKFLQTAEDVGTVCEFQAVTSSKIASLAVKKAAKSGVVLSDADADYLTERCGGQMSRTGDETQKLITYVGKGGVITRETIDRLVSKDPSAKIFDLGNAITSGRRTQAFSILDDLFEQQTRPEMITSALSLAFLDLYRAKLAKNAGLSPEAATAKFCYAKNRSWVFGKLYQSVSRLDIGYLRKAVELMSDCDIRIKSSPVDNRIIIEETVSRIFELSKKL